MSTFLRFSVLTSVFLPHIPLSVSSSWYSGDGYLSQATAKKYCTRYSTPPCWPNHATWSAFNATLGGDLIQVIPWANPCFTNPGPFDVAACQNIKGSYTDSFIRADQVGYTELDNWAYCYTNKGEVGDCTLIVGDLNPTPEPPGRQCRLGRISPYAVAVTSPRDIQESLAFAKNNNIKVVIKNTGHDYLGRGTAPDTLMIWTHNLQSLEYSDAFTPVGGSESYPAIIMGAGVQAEQGYRLAASKGKEITLGAYDSVGVAGGFALGGGHGPLQPKHGLAVDNILQYTVVTADNRITIANAFQNSDLYFALRGGGGGTWGVVVEVVYKVYDALPFTAVEIRILSDPTQSYRQRLGAIADFTENLASHEVELRKKGWSGYIFILPSFILFTHLLPGGTLLDATKDMEEFLSYLYQRQAIGQWQIANSSITEFPNFEACREILFKRVELMTPVAISQIVSSRLINFYQFTTPELREAMGVAVAKAYDAAFNDDGIPSADIPYRVFGGILIFSTGPLPARFGGPTGEDTGVNTAWRDSIWDVLSANAWNRGISQNGRNAIRQKNSRAMNFLRPMGDGAYFNEADTLEPNWQTAFFGGNYAKLLQIKQKWDPDNMFVVFKGVGYEGHELQEAFECYQQA